MTRLTIKIMPPPESICEITIINGLLKDAGALTGCLKELAGRIAIITHHGLREPYAEPLRRLLVGAGLETHIFSFPDGEQHKSRQTKESLEDAMLEVGLGRDTCLVALGGGIVSDVAGFVAATYCRGIPLVVIPTSLMGMVDASMGGKTGINVPQGKNLIGSIHQPKAILIDPSVLRSLPLREIKNGIAEMIKHGLIADAAYFEWLGHHAAALLALEPQTMTQAILESCRIKAAIVSQDEREGGIRALLNYGHTVAHALERLTDYAMPHGEAVSVGLLVETRLAVELGVLGVEDYERVKAILTNYGMASRIPVKLTVEACLEVMSMDKKSLKGRPRFVLLKAIGAPQQDVCVLVDEAVLHKTLQWMIDDLCRH